MRGRVGVEMFGRVNVAQSSRFDVSLAEQPLQPLQPHAVAHQPLGLDAALPVALRIEGSIN